MTKIKSEIVREISRPLSSEQIIKYIPGINIVIYPDLIKYNSIDELLGKIGACILLYMTNKNFGHWTLLFKRDRDNLEFFDSYGTLIDDEIKKLNYESGVQLNDFHALSIMILSSPYKNLICSRTQLQCWNPMVQTCGRWCVVRYLMKDMDIDDFISFFYKFNKNIRDAIVTLMTMELK